MATVCRIRPRVKTPDGRMADSRLHEDLSHFTDGDKVAQDNMWAVSRSEAVEWQGEPRRDENGEPTVESLLGQTDMGELLPDDRIAEGLTSLHAAEATAADRAGVRLMQRRSAEWNEKSPLNGRAVASAEVSGGSARQSWSVKSDEAEALSEETRRGLALSDRMEAWLAERGVAVGALAEAEEGAGIDGVTDFSSTRRTAEGLRELIRVAHGEAGRLAVTEEAAHVAVMALAGKDRAVDRALAQLSRSEALVKSVLGDQYAQYAERYSGDKTKLAHEAAGHLLRDALRGEFASREAGGYSSLWRRMADAVLDFFRRMTTSDIDKMLEETRAGMRSTARRILDDDCYKELDFSEEAEAIGRLFALDGARADATMEQLRDMVERLIRDNKSRIKRIPAYLNKKNGKKSRFQFLSDLGEEMKKAYDKKQYLTAVYKYLANASSDLTWQLNTFKTRYDKAKPENKAYIINNIDEYVTIYHQVLKDAMAVVDKMLGENPNDKELKEILPQLQKLFNGYVNDKGKQVYGLSSLLDQCSMRIRNYKMPTFLAFVSKFVKLDNIIVPKGGKAYGVEGGERVDFETQMMESPEVGSIDKWFLPAALSNSMPVQVFQRVMHEAQMNVRDMTIEYSKRLKELTFKLEEAGVHGQEWMFERKDGKLTGNYISKRSEEYRKLSDAKREYYDAVMEIKNELDAMLPHVLRNLTNAPKIRKDFMEQLEREDKGSWRVVKDYMSEAWSVKSDDEYTLDKDKVIMDYNNHQLRMIPIRFLSFKPGEDDQNLSMDIVETMTRYAQMCCNYSTMTRIMPALELGRSILSEGVSTHEKVVTDENGNRVMRTVVGEKRGKDDNTMNRINDIMETGYGFKTENVVMNVGGHAISVTALGQRLMAITAANQYMMSVNAAVQNSITAQLQMLSETVGGKYYDGGDLAWAQSVYAQNVGDMLGDVNSRAPKSKISLFNEKFNVLMKDEPANFNRRGAKRLMEMKNLYFMTTLGEFHANTVISLAVSHRVKLRAADGSEISLWDALEVVDMAEKRRREAKRLRAAGNAIAADKLEEDIAKHPEWSNSRSRELVLREGVTKPDGTEFTTADVHSLTRRMMHVSHVLNGVYNPEDAAKWQRYIGGQMIGMYRKWIAPSWYRRINGLQYSLDDNEWSEGFYRTFIRVNWNRVKALFDKTLAAEIKGRELQSWEKANLRKATFEIGMLLAAMGLKMLMSTYKDKRRSFAWNILYYYTVRTTSELSTMNPVGMVVESNKILANPSAVLPTINNMFGLIGSMMNPYEWGILDNEDAYVQSGKYKGMTKLERAFVKAPLLPGSHQWLAFWYPEDSVKFYE